MFSKTLIMNDLRYILTSLSRMTILTFFKFTIITTKENQSVYILCFFQGQIHTNYPGMIKGAMTQI